MIQRLFVSILLGILVLAQSACSQGPPLRRHTATKRSDLKLVPANRQLDLPSQVLVTMREGKRIMEVNSIPKHPVGAFPNRGNPHAIEARKSTFQMPLEPQASDQLTPIRLGFNFGIGLNGVLFDPLAAEFWQGSRNSGWQYEALGGAVPLGLDQNLAHVQPDGKYHYHGIPAGLLKQLETDRSQHSPVIGWAADGFPIYARTGYQDPKDPSSPIVELRPSYRLKTEPRPGGNDGPGGQPDGAFINDYEYVPKLGDLDECNGRFCVTPEYRQGTYAYFLTDQWPVIPRYWKGTPDSSFASRLGPPGRRGPPPRRRPGGQQ